MGLSPNYLKYVKIGGAEEHVFSSGKIAEIPPRKKQMQFLGIGHGRRAGTLLLLLLMHFFSVFLTLRTTSRRGSLNCVSFVKEERKTCAQGFFM